MIITFFRVLRLSALLIALCLLSSCREIRAIPGHGGGKRFSEEQRAITKSIRAAVDDMNLKEIQGKKVRVILQSISHSGGGSTRLPGWNNFDMRKTISSSVSNSIANSIGGYRSLVDPKFLLGKDETSTGSETNRNDFSTKGDDRTGTNDSFYHSYRYQPNATLNTHSVSTNTDLNYLNSILQMKCHHEGIVLSNTGDHLLYVIVDILGTNRSRNDLIAFTKDKLTGECEISYYVMNKKGQMVFKLRSTGAKSTYGEQAFIGFNLNRPTHNLQRISPEPIMSFSKKNEAKNIKSSLNDSDIIDISMEHNVKETADPDELANQIDTLIKDGNLEKAKILLKSLKKIDSNHPSVESFSSTLE
jgi:hypothetical protein